LRKGGEGYLGIFFVTLKPHYKCKTTKDHDEHHKNLYTRIEVKNGIKMKGYTAVQRKLLVLIYTLWKKNKAYDPNYKNKKGEVQKNLEQPIGAALIELDLVRPACPEA
jgi:hypothetical protein